MDEPSPRDDVAKSQPSGPVIRRLLRMLRPHGWVIAIALVLLLLSMPGELFPGLIWMYVTDRLITHEPTTASDILHTLVSFNGRLQGWRPLLLRSEEHTSELQ